jgi:hypothetical protein
MGLFRRFRGTYYTSSGCLTVVKVDAEVTGRKKYVNYTGMLEGFWSIRPVGSNSFSKNLIGKILEMFLHNQHISASLLFQHPQKPNSVTVKNEAAISSKRPGQDHYTRQHENPKDHHLMVDSTVNRRYPLYQVGSWNVKLISNFIA